MKRFLGSKRTRIFLYLILVFGLVGCLSISYAGLEHNMSGWAWSSTMGWISFNSINCDADGNGRSDGEPHCPPAGTVITDYGVDIDLGTGYLSGYAWASNIGWIKFNPAPDFNTGLYPEDPQQPVKLDLCTYDKFTCTNQFSGWARACAGTVNKSCNSPTRTDDWDGWIKLAGTTLDGNSYVVEKEKETHIVKGWGWGSKIVGWVKFKGIAQDTSPYGVIAAFSPPQILDTWWEEYNRCFGDSRGVILWWEYSDLEKDDQASYRIQIDNDSDLSSPFHDTEEKPSSDDFYIPDPDILDWNITYYWRVRVKDVPGSWSDWSDIDTFDTPLHQYPYPRLDWTPEYPNAYDPDYPEQPGVNVSFRDQSTCYDVGGIEVPCVSWTWTFSTPGDADPDTSNEQNPVTKFLSEGDKDVTLEVCDSTLPDPYCCPLTKSIYVNFPLPEWKERIPR